MYYWIMLTLAILAEVTSTIGMKFAATTSPALGYLLMAVMISFSFYAFSRAVIRIPLAVSYAIWEGLGLFLIGLSGVVFFGEHLKPNEILAVGIMMFGLMLVTFDKGHTVEDEKAQQPVKLAQEISI